MTPRIGSLFTGTGALDMAVEQVTGGETIWHSDIDPGANAILEHHWPGRPNLGNIETVNWLDVESVDILTAGFPCHDVSAAGKRLGLIRYGADRTRSGLWAETARAIETLRPSLVVAENVRGLLSAKADSDMERCPTCMGDADGAAPDLRALGAVLADLAELGYDARWHGLRASDVGAPHQRFREFIVAYPANAQNVGHQRAGTAWRRRDGSADGGHVAADLSDADGPGLEGRHESGRGAAGGWPGAHRGGQLSTGCGAQAVADTDRDGHESLRRVDTSERDADGCDRQDRTGHQAEPAARTDWAEYGPAVARWELVTGRPAPSPTEATDRGAQRLSPTFVEWMMGLPLGHVTAVPGLTRAMQLKALGNGVVPQQAVAALQHLLAAQVAA